MELNERNTPTDAKWLAVKVCRKLRNDQGPSGELGAAEDCVFIGGKFYPLAWIEQSGAGLLPCQVERGE
jgi:hypothetical protein